MSSVFKYALAPILLMSITAQAVPPAKSAPSPNEVLRVCADPNNLPFSNRAGRGFENALAAMIARDLGRTVQYTWWPQRRGFIRNTLRAQRCDVVMGVPVGYELTDTTAAYYRSSYVFVTRPPLRIESLDDPRLKELRIGVHVIGDDYANPPPAQALAQRGIVTNVRGYSIYGDYSRPDPPRELIDAVVRNEIDVAIAWGPLGGYFASVSAAASDLAMPDVAMHDATSLIVTPLASADSSPLAPMTFDIALGVRRDDAELKRILDQELVRRRDDIKHLLQSYHVPLLQEVAVRAEVPDGD